MSELTPRMGFPYPSERERPFFQTYKAGELARDAAHWAHSENANLTFVGGGTWSWDAGTHTLSWTDPVQVRGFSSTGYLVIAPQSYTIYEDEVVFFNMLRLLKTPTAGVLEKGKTISKPGVRAHDLLMFVARIGNVLYFPGGASMVDGDAGQLFGAGLPGGGGGSINLLVAGNGIVITNPAGPTATIEADFAGTGGTFGTSNQVARSDHTHPALGHNHEPEMAFNPVITTNTINANADGLIATKTLLAVAVYRRGQRLAQGIDYSVNLPGKFINLNYFTTPGGGDIHVIDRITI